MNTSAPVRPIGEPTSAADDLDGRGLSLPLEDRPRASNIETALTDEMLRLSRFISESALRLQAVRENASDDLGKLVLSAQSLFFFEFSNAILKSMDRGCSLTEYADNLNKLELGLREAFREVVLDGRKFLCIACTDDAAREFFGRNKAGEKGGDVHGCSDEKGAA